LRYQEVLQLSQDFGDKRQVSRCLLGLAQILLAQSEIEDVAYLLGAAESSLRPHDLYLEQRLNLQHVKERACSQLGEENFTKRWQQGFSASLEHVLSTLA
jgi:hypothetical protein